MAGLRHTLCVSMRERTERVLLPGVLALRRAQYVLAALGALGSALGSPAGCRRRTDLNVTCVTAAVDALINRPCPAPSSPSGTGQAQRPPAQPHVHQDRARRSAA